MRTRLIPAVHGIVRLAAKFLFGLREWGRDNIPRTGPVILASNHISDWDPPVMGTASTRVPYYMAKSELFRGGAARFLLDRLGAFPVNRTGVDTGAIRTSVSLLEQGHALAMFPEGTRSRTGLLGRGRQGIALIARRSASPMVPVYISGTVSPGKALFRPGGFSVAFGPPITPAETESAFLAGGNQGVSNLVMERIADAGKKAGIFKGYIDEDDEGRINE